MSLARSLKVHLRLLRVGDTTMRIVRLRPQTAVRFSTNHFHDTWHILADEDGAAILGRLLWGLAFQRRPGTVVLIDGPHLVPTPFEGDPPDPILLVPDGLTSLDLPRLRALRQRLRRDTGWPTTIRWHAFGLAAVDQEARGGRPFDRALERRERMSRRAGFVCYTAPAAVLRDRGAVIHRMRRGSSSYLPLACEDRAWPAGELQIVPHLADRSSSAVVARREILQGPDRPLGSHEERVAVWDRAAVTLQRLRDARR